MYPAHTVSILTPFFMMLRVPSRSLTRAMIDDPSDDAAI